MRCTAAEGTKKIAVPSGPDRRNFILVSGDGDPVSAAPCTRLTHVIVGSADDSAGARIQLFHTDNNRVREFGC
jgi:hypothetical protein